VCGLQHFTAESTVSQFFAHNVHAGRAGLEMGHIRMFRGLDTQNGARRKSRGRHAAAEASYNRHQDWWADIPTGLQMSQLTQAKGSSSIVDEKTHQPILSILSLIVETAIKLRSDGHRVVIVSSGAIAVGLRRMNLPKRPKHLPQVQVQKMSLSRNSLPLNISF
jgi:hypothetical protein